LIKVKVLLFHFNPLFFCTNSRIGGTNEAIGILLLYVGL